MIRVKNLEIYGALAGDQKPLERLASYPWPLKTAYGLAKLARRLAEQFAVIEQVKNGLVNQYGVPDDKGRPSINNESLHWPEFVAAFNELMAIEVEVECAVVVLPNQEHLPEEERNVVPTQLLIPLLSFVELAEDDIIARPNGHDKSARVLSLVEAQ